MKTLNFCSYALSIGAAAAFLAACGGSQSSAPQVPAVSGVRPAASGARYKLVDLGTFGGPNSVICTFSPVCEPSQVLNNQGTVVGTADTSIPDHFPNFCFDALINNFPPDCFTARAFATQNRDIVRLNGFGYSAVAVSVSNNDLTAGIAQNGKTDPLVPGFPEVRAAFWQNRQITNLGTFGGGESLANGINDHGQVAGTAANTVTDPYSFIYVGLGVSNGTQARAFLWQDGVKRDLGTLGGPDAFAIDVNERGQVAGWSYINSTPNGDTGVPTFHPFLWQNDKMRDLGTLGGTQVLNIEGFNERGEVLGLMTLKGEQRAHPFLWNGHRLIDLGTFGGSGGDGAWINARGEVVGWGGTTQKCPKLHGGGQHPFLWRDGVKKDLGAVPGTDNGDANWVNSKSQVVGESFSCDASTFDAFLWEKGAIVDLNTLIHAGSELHLFYAIAINDRGEIAGLGSLPNGDVHTFLLLPNGDNADILVATKQSNVALHAVNNRQLTPAEIIAIRAILVHRHLGFRWLKH